MAAARTARDGPAISVDGLSKRFGRRIAVDDATFDVPHGAVAGFVGPNGAGKTTTLRILLGLVHPTSGQAHVLGHPVDDPASYLGRVGALVERPAFYAGLTGRRNLEVLATLSRVDRSRVDATLEQVRLQDRADDPFRSYSLGMKQRLGIAAALLRDPELLILDEPTNGLDPAGIRDMRALVADIGAAGLTLFVSSHLLGEIQSVCDWLVVVERGRLAYQGATDVLLGGGTEQLVVVPAELDHLRSLEQIAHAAGHGARVEGRRVLVTAPADAAADLSRRASEAGITLVELTPVRTSLEDRFFELTGGAS